MPRPHGSWLPKMFAILAAFATTFSLADISPAVTKIANAINMGCVTAIGLTVRQNGVSTEEVRKPKVTTP